LNRRTLFRSFYYPSGQRGPILGRDIVQNSRYFFQMGERRHLARIQGDNLSSDIGAPACYFGGKVLSLNRLWFQLPNLDLEISQARKSVRQDPKGPD
jgi:hypothetical protein